LPSPRAASIKKFDIDIDITPNIMYLLTLSHPIPTRAKWIKSWTEKQTEWQVIPLPGVFEGRPNGLKAVKPEAVSIIR